jgi:hypothetical protein
VATCTKCGQSVPFLRLDIVTGVCDACVAGWPGGRVTSVKEFLEPFCKSHHLDLSRDDTDFLVRFTSPSSLVIEVRIGEAWSVFSAREGWCATARRQGETDSNAWKYEYVGDDRVSEPAATLLRQNSLKECLEFLLAPEIRIVQRQRSRWLALVGHRSYPELQRKDGEKWIPFPALG